ncbi:MAG: helix-hairpin-helix domain-containing protein, partial [Candidatus Marsarchaeota archaeon]|nr:helix-hairpin-helix domain-containing protein [Candidatus Marsarchaeota archaeon]
MENKRIGEIFDEIADIIEIEDSKRIFEIRAYRKAALTIRELQEDVAGILNKKGIKGLMEFSGIGEGLAKKIEEYVKTGHIKKYDELKKKYPIDFTSLTKVRGLGSKKAFKLYKELGIKDMKGLQEAIKKNKVRSIEGFGEKSEDVLKKGVASVEAASSRMLLGTALPEAEAILHKLLESKLVERAEIAGSSRRMKETVGDLDILIISEKPEEAMDFATRIDEVESVLLKGPTKSTVWLKIGLSCDIRVVPKESFGAAMQYFIGNKSHNVKVRQIAIKKGYKLNEYGLFDRREKIIESQNEAEIYKILGMAYPVPEMREDRGEIDLALQDKLPVPVALGDICGDLHVHSTNSDGADTIEDMALAAWKLGY